ncbi:hypothetical protein ONS95_004335 [Cadophora gregata]|uniref:uncharacterized protein n=1 Tax=Cadophora gregata TaxID=51156 RepID=UPI0026DBAAA4|nr:uncharacterized protein ONS95_004335 [Cadophora gregata]KAK0105280.1 hypothetical protein ONS96_004676 [Cadophora gregata f. sp. sojae]KAK0105819.1 hypothetical protein ONS95_004335 [Cadophora gregata]
MAELCTDKTPAAVRNATGLRLITESTPNEKRVQILLEQLKDAYGIVVDNYLNRPRNG